MNYRLNSSGLCPTCVEFIGAEDHEYCPNCGTSLVEHEAMTCPECDDELDADDPMS